MPDLTPARALAAAAILDVAGRGDLADAVQAGHDRRHEKPEPPLPPHLTEMEDHDD